MPFELELDLIIFVQSNKMFSQKFPLNLLLALVAIYRADFSSCLEYSGTEILSNSENKFSLQWKINQSSQTIHFTATAKTTGYVGFGLSPNGAMNKADILIAGVFPNGTVYSADYHGIGNQIPELDSKQNWIVTSAIEKGGYTLLEFYRQLDTCDSDDIKITTDTMRLIYALGQTDNLTYHALERGSKSVSFFLLNQSEPDSSKYFQKEITHTLEMPSADTTYWCTIHELPQLNTTHHIIRFEPLLDSLDAIEHTHHFILYRCLAQEGDDAEELFSPFINHPGDHCYIRSDKHLLPFQNYCMGNLIYAWSKGGKPLTFPENVGFPLNPQPGQKEYWALEIHYDNPKNSQGKVFKSGAKIYYSDVLREHEAGLMRVEHFTGAELTIPPKSKDFVVAGHCSPECTLTAFPPEGITVFNILLHSHLAGRKLKLRHFRQNRELEVLAKDDNYDFDYQQNRELLEPRRVLPGDQMTVECSYKTGDKAVIGGLSAREEMCQAWMFYWPKIKYSVCGSKMDYEEHLNLLGLTAGWAENGYEGGMGSFWIVGPENLKGNYVESLSFKMNWTEEFRREFQREKRFGRQEPECSAGFTRQVFGMERLGYPEDLIEWKEDDKCDGENGRDIEEDEEFEDLFSQLFGLMF